MTRDSLKHRWKIRNHAQNPPQKTLHATAQKDAKSILVGSPLMTVGRAALRFLGTTNATAQPWTLGKTRKSLSLKGGAHERTPRPLLRVPEMQ